MSGVLIADDARIVRFLRLEKLYADDDPFDSRPRAEVSLWRADEIEAQYVLAVPVSDKTGGA